MGSQLVAGRPCVTDIWRELVSCMPELLRAARLQDVLLCSECLRWVLRGKAFAATGCVMRSMEAMADRLTGSQLM